MNKQRAVRLWKQLAADERLTETGCARIRNLSTGVCIDQTGHAGPHVDVTGHEWDEACSPAPD